MKPQIDWDSFAWHIRDAIKDGGASLRDLQRITGVDHATIQRASQGRPIRVEAYLALCDLLDADPRYWFTDAEGVTAHERRDQ